MIHPALSDEEIGRRGRQLYEDRVRAEVETDGNLGKIVCIDIDTGAFEVDSSGIEAARRLHARHPGAAVYGERIGYNAVFSLGGVITRTKQG